MFSSNGWRMGKRCDGTGRSQGGDSRSQAFDVQRSRDFCICCVESIGYRDIQKEFACGVDAFNESRFLGCPCCEKCRGIIIKCEAATTGVGPFGRRRWRGDVDSVRESVGKLRAQVTFLGIHAPNQNEARTCDSACSIALGLVSSRRCGIEEKIREMVWKQVDFVDVEGSVVGGCNEAGLLNPAA
jgi:hypothetical protein